MVSVSLPPDKFVGPPLCFQWLQKIKSKVWGCHPMENVYIKVVKTGQLVQEVNWDTCTNKHAHTHTQTHTALQYQ